MGARAGPCGARAWSARMGASHGRRARGERASARAFSLARAPWTPWHYARHALAHLGKSLGTSAARAGLKWILWHELGTRQRLTNLDLGERCALSLGWHGRTSGDPRACLGRNAKARPMDGPWRRPPFGRWDSAEPPASTATARLARTRHVRRVPVRRERGHDLVAWLDPSSGSQRLDNYLGHG
ncbi:hypothetical protein Syun_030558 [Stephania yunnanensis]|uniref:Uncharacterized protein n=1 Tax=Stephania yunnanensis TaxID=152371 RepID=A0AAP0HFP7_9MAGN